MKMMIVMMMMMILIDLITLVGILITMVILIIAATVIKIIQFEIARSPGNDAPARTESKRSRVIVALYGMIR